MGKNIIIGILILGILALGIIFMYSKSTASDLSISDSLLEKNALDKKDESITTQSITSGILSYHLPEGWKIDSPSNILHSTDFVATPTDSACVEVYGAQKGSVINISSYPESVSSSIESSNDYYEFIVSSASDITGSELIKRIEIDNVPFVYNQGTLPGCGKYVIVRGRVSGQNITITLDYFDKNDLTKFNLFLEGIKISQ